MHRFSQIPDGACPQGQVLYETLHPAAVNNCLYSCFYPGFGNKRSLQDQMRFCNVIAKEIPGYAFGFRKDASTIAAVRAM